ncbi:MAG: hypothetical protein HXX14_13245 [Bacteroidetes bacterium]|nr:hypothetical protein [Bacteroidota bacterium]
MNRLFWVLKAMMLYVFLGSLQLHAQSLPVGTPVLEDAYRRAQLLGQIDSSISFTSRPFYPKTITPTGKNLEQNRLLKNYLPTSDTLLRFINNKGIVQLLPITWFQQYNSDHPAGMNDGIMIPARGYQTLFSAGIFAKFGPLSIQLEPEVVYAENKAFEYKTYKDIPYNSNIDILYADYRAGIDLPERFGNSSYHKISWGQSSIRLTFGPISFGLSNENLWWGPGIYNSLLMTNNAPGFEHFTINTVTPIRTPIGSFEGQLIGGRLDGSGFSPSKPDDWRYLNGTIITYQPRWVPGLFLGVTRTYQVYHKDMGNGITDYLPVLNAITKQASGGNSQDAGKSQDQVASFFMRWLWTKEKGEIYFEYGREDHAWNLRDLITEPTSSAAYILGLRKAILLNKLKNEYIQVNMEVTQLEMDNITLNRIGGSWYVHYPILHGYTNRGQVLGAGIGPGSNLQTINISWNRKLVMIGLQFDRYVHDNDFFQKYIKDIRSNWVDLSEALVCNWQYKNILLNSKIAVIRSKNYKWQYAPNLSYPQLFWNSTHDVYNIQGQLGITYRF